MLGPFLFLVYISHLPEVAARTQPSRPRPRTLKKSEAKAKDRVAEDRLPRGQGQKGSKPRPRNGLDLSLLTSLF